MTAMHGGLFVDVSSTEIRVANAIAHEAVKTTLMTAPAFFAAKAAGIGINITARN